MPNSQIWVVATLLDNGDTGYFHQDRMLYCKGPMITLIIVKIVSVKFSK